MNSANLHVSVQDLERKIMRLLEGYKEQQKMVQQLRQQHEQVIRQITDRAEPAQDFSISLTRDVMAKKSGNLRAWEAKIDSYISAIDEGIAYLERPQ
jgi:DNA-binding ferritin-like protein